MAIDTPPEMQKECKDFFVLKALVVLDTEAYLLRYLLVGNDSRTCLLKKNRVSDCAYRELMQFLIDCVGLASFCGISELR